MSDSTDPNPVRFVRQKVFDATQEQFADIGEVSRTRVTRYESGGEKPPYSFMARVRAEALRRGLPFSADWFFAVPVEAVPAEPPTHVRAREDVQ